MDPTPFLCGNAFAGNDKVPYPRASIHDTFRMPFDTWMQAQLPATVRLEIAGDASAIDISYETETEDLGYRGDGAGRTFALWRFLKPVSEEKAELGSGTVRLVMGPEVDHRAIVYLPEGMRPRVLDVEPIGGSIESDPLAPVGEYAASCVGRERMYEYFAEAGGPGCLDWASKKWVDSVFVFWLGWCPVHGWHPFHFSRATARVALAPEVRAYLWEHPRFFERRSAALGCMKKVSGRQIGPYGRSM